MPRCITICPIGPVKEDIIVRIAQCINTRSRVLCRIAPEMKKPEYAYNKRRRQYDSKLILQHLLECCPQDTLRFVGVIGEDLYVPILKFVYGLSQIQGRCCVISTHRLRPRFYGHPEDQGLFISRIEKTALHELGHSFGLTHCRERSCVMFSSSRIEDTDFKQPDFCPTCLELLKWHIAKIPSH